MSGRDLRTNRKTGCTPAHRRGACSGCGCWRRRIRRSASWPGCPRRRQSRAHIGVSRDGECAGLNHGAGSCSVIRVASRCCRAERRRARVCAGTRWRAPRDLGRLGCGGKAGRASSPRTGWLLKNSDLFGGGLNRRLPLVRKPIQKRLMWRQTICHKNGGDFWAHILGNNSV